MAALPPALSQRTEWNAVQQGLKRLLGYIQIAAFHMVIYNPDCLHIRIYNRTAYKLKAAFFKSLLILSESGVVAGMSVSDLK